MNLDDDMADKISQLHIGKAVDFWFAPGHDSQSMIEDAVFVLHAITNLSLDFKKVTAGKGVGTTVRIWIRNNPGGGQ